MPTTLGHGKTSKFTPEQIAAVKSELDSLLNSGQFSGTRRCYEFLEFVVSRSLAGDYDSLTERTIGAEIFGRPIDYETATDAIVRVRANDVRRRLAEYYSERRPISPVSISLPPGSYIPEFHWTSPEVQPSPIESSEANASQNGSATLTLTRTLESDPGTGQHRVKKPLLISVGILLVGIVGLAIFAHNSVPQDPAIRKFWKPLIQQRGSVIVCFGNTTSYWPSNSVKEAIDRGDRSFTVNPGEISKTRDDSATVGNLRAAVSILTLLSGYGVTNELRWPQEVQSTDLSRSNVIFVGAFNNPWSMSLNEGLRFSFKQIHTGDKAIWTIQDRTSPSEKWSITKAYPEQAETDYALVTRIIDPDGKRIIIAVGGLSQFGTQAAGEFVTDETDLSTFAKSAPSGWEHRNLQIVLGLRLDGRKIVNSRVLATNIW